VTEPAELTHGVLLKVAEFLRKLPADQLDDLVRGDAKLELVPKGGRAAPARKATTKPVLSRPAEEIRATLEGIGDRVAARRYLETDLKLTIAGLQALGREFGITVRSRKAQALDDVVEWAVGRSQDSDAISRRANPR
jgi:hypothetical protein